MFAKSIITSSGRSFLKAGAFTPQVNKISFLTSMQSQSAYHSETGKQTAATATKSTSFPNKFRKNKGIFDFTYGSNVNQMFHYTTYSLVGLIPAGLALGGPFQLAADLCLGLVIPVHAHIGMVAVIEDYIYGPSLKLATGAMAAVTGITLLGLLKLNISDVGICGSLKLLWNKEKVKQLQEAKETSVNEN